MNKFCVPTFPWVEYDFLCFCDIPDQWDLQGESQHYTESVNLFLQFGYLQRQTIVLSVVLLL